MEHFSAEILNNTSVGQDHFRLDFTVPWQDFPVSGQFLTLSAGPDHLLKRPFSIADWQNGSAAVIFKVVGPATRYLAGLKPGDVCTVLGPLGRGFPEIDGEILYVGGGCGMPPLLYAARQRQGQGGQVFAGFRTGADIILREDFEACDTEYRIATEDGSEGHKGRVTDILKNYLDSDNGKRIMFASGPLAMLRSVAQLVAEYACEAYLSLESYMACGFGVCNGCVQMIQNPDGSRSYKRVCKEGPVFKAEDIVWEQT